MQNTGLLFCHVLPSCTVLVLYCIFSHPVMYMLLHGVLQPGPKEMTFCSKVHKLQGGMTIKPTRLFNGINQARADFQ